MRRRWGRLAACLILCTLLLCAYCCGAALAEEAPEAAPLTVNSAARSGMVRVYLSSLGSPTTLDVTVAGSYTTSGGAAMELTGGDVVRVSFDAQSGSITLSKGGVSVQMGQEAAFRRHATGGTNGLRIAQAKKPANLYPGDLYLTAQKSGSGYKLYAIVHVYIENYLCGVVPYEMGDGAQLEALKAQAVAARTYTLGKMNARASGLYDVVDTTNDQVYYGNSDATTNCTAAVNATKGIVVMNGSALTATYYTASNGGQTESARNAWGSTGYSYLTVKEDPYDLTNAASTVKSAAIYSDNAASGQRSALKTLLASKADAALKALGYTSGTVQTISAVTPHTPKFASPSRLYTKMDFDLTCLAYRSGTASTARVTVTCDIFTELETALGLSINGSSNELWTVTRSSSGWTVSARRYGHGVGMSQRGAMRMGALGYTYAQILGFYYEGCTRVQYSFTHTILSALGSGVDETITTTEDPAQIEGESGCMATVTLVSSAKGLAIRQSASAQGRILTAVMSGSALTVLEKGDAWTLVRYGSIVGYVQTSALTISGIAPTASTATPTAITGYATVKCTGTLNLRESASSSAKVLTVIPSGAVLPVFARSGAYASVQYGAFAGWAVTDFLVFTDEYPESVADPEGTQAVVTVSGGGTVNLRASASTSAKVLMTLQSGTVVTAQQDDGSWCRVLVSGQTGYVMSAYLTYAGSGTATPAPTSTPATGETEAVVQTIAADVPLLGSAQETAQVLARIPRGESIIVTQRGDAWCAARYGGITGFVQTKYLYFPGGGTTAPIIGFAQVTTASGSLNLRSQPMTGSTVLRTIPRLARVSVVEQGESWTRVIYADTAGYVMTAFLTFESLATPTPPLETATPAPVEPTATPAPASPTPLPGEPTAAPRYARVATPAGSLNLRQSASATAKVLAQIPRSARVLVAQAGESWCLTDWMGQAGYVMTQFLAFEDATASPAPTQTPQPETTEGVATVATGGGRLNLRASASTLGNVVGTVADGAQVALLEQGSIWCRVRAGALTGYVMTKYLHIGGGTAAGDRATVWTVSGSLNLREQPSSAGKVLVRLPRLSTVEVLASDPLWCSVRYGGVTGFVMTAYLRFDGAAATATPAPGVTATPSPAPTAAPTAEAATVITPSGGLNLRESASSAAKVLGVIPRQAVVTVTERGSDWCGVRYGSLAGYVMTKYLVFAGDAATAAPQTTPEQATATPAPATQAPQKTAIPTGEAKTMFVVTGGGALNLRETASPDAGVLTQIPEFAPVSCVESGTEWSLVTYGSFAGYVKTKYLSATIEARQTPTAAPAAQSTPCYDETLEKVENTVAVVISDGALNLRSWCATDAPILAEIPAGTILQALEKGSEWMRVRWAEGEVEGYCGAKYVLLTELAP